MRTPDLASSSSPCSSSSSSSSSYGLLLPKQLHRPPTAPSLLPSFLHTKPRKTHLAFRATGDGGRRKDVNHRPPGRTIPKVPEPPWTVPTPPPPDHPFPLLAQNLPLMTLAGGGTGIPISLRLLQMKKRLSQPARPLSLEDEYDSHAATAVAAMLFMVEELQKPVLESDGGGRSMDRVRDRRDCFVWLFRRVFANSPNVVLLVLLLLADYVADCTEDIFTRGLQPRESSVVEGTKENELNKKKAEEGEVVAEDCVDLDNDKPVVGCFGGWSDVGIKEGTMDGRRAEEETCEDRRRRAYERCIAGGDLSPLILCNYAQFLYKVAHDYDRAEQYFVLAVNSEPKDAEAASRYALFLWEERGDFSKAEEMFLEAIDLEKGSLYHRSSYAFFLWKTGAQDTCFPLAPPSC